MKTGYSAANSAKQPQDSPQESRSCSRQVCIPTPDACLLLPSQHLPMTKAAFCVRLRRLGTVWISLTHSNEPAAVYSFLTSYHNAHFLAIRFLLKSWKCYAIMASSTGETGASPVRDRRRKAQKVTVLIRIPRSEETPLEKFLRRPDGDASKSEYPGGKTPKICCGKPAWGKYNLRRIQR